MNWLCDVYRKLVLDIYCKFVKFEKNYPEFSDIEEEEMQWMGITKVSIRNFKSIKNILINLERDKYDLQCFIGENGAGKSNFLDALNYFYKNLVVENIEKGIIDTNNKYLQYAYIEIEYDFSQLKVRNTNKYYDEKLFEILELLEDDTIKIKMVQYKDGSIKWYPREADADVRKLLHKVFPIFFIDTRFISLQNWSEIWSAISDVSINKMNIESEKIKEKINELMLDAYGEKYTKTINIIERVFKNENIKIDDSSYWECYTELLKLRLGGEKFLNEENKLTYFSDGLNSLKYIKLIIELIANLSSTGWKNPLLIIDEPEIGLHSLYIDELIECVQSNINKNVNMMLTTHSPHLVSSIIKNEIPISIWRIFFENNHSKFEKMQDIIEEKQKYLISDIETGCYFSNALLFVEGKSEKQLFFNKNIKKLYPDIKKINIVNYDSDNSMLDLVYPEHMKFSVPYLVLVDMDKILKYSYRSGKFKLNSDNLVNPLYSTTVKEKQKYLYYKKDGKKEKTYNQRLKIEKMINKAIFNQTADKLFIDDYFFELIIIEIKKYCIQYNVLPVRTTIEGVLVNEVNVEIAYEWIKNKLETDLRQELDNILSRESINNKKYRTTIIRCCLSGKLDVLKNINEKEVLVDQNVKSCIVNIKERYGKKTGGWINEFINYYFSRYIDGLDNTELKVEKFANDFKELNFILRKSLNMLK